MNITEVRRAALALPEVTEEPHFAYSSFRVRGKIFITVPPDEEAIHVFVPVDLRAEYLARHAEFVEELHWGKKVVGLRVALAFASPEVVRELVRQSWAGKAPKRIQGGDDGER